MEKSKQFKFAKMFALITIALLLIVILYPSDKGYKVRKEEVNATGVKTTIEVVLQQKEPKEKLEEISKHFREKYKTENVLIFFFLTDTDNYNYAYAGWHGNNPDKVLIFEREQY